MLKRILASLLLGISASATGEDIHTRYYIKVHTGQTNTVGFYRDNPQLPEISDLVIKKKVPFSDKEFNMLMNERRNSRASALKDIRSLEPNLATLVMIPLEEKIDKVNMASGFYLCNSGFLLSAHHTIKDSISSKQIIGAVSFSKSNEPRFEKLELLAYSEERDIALCKVKYPDTLPDQKPVFLTEGTLTDGQYLTCLFREFGTNSMPFYQVISPEGSNTNGNGTFEGFSFDLRKNKNGRYTPEITLTEGIRTIYSFGEAGSIHKEHGLGKKEYTFTNIKMENGEHSFLLPIYSKMEPGNSGAPVFTTQGSLAGMVVLKKVGENSGYIVAPQTIRDFLASYQEKASAK